MTKKIDDILAAGGVSNDIIIATGTVTIEAAAANKNGPRRFEIFAYSGGLLPLKNFEHPVIVDLQGIEGIDRSRPVLKDHLPSQIVGHTTSIRNNGRDLTAQGVVSGTGQAAREVVTNSDNEFPWQASIGASPLRMEAVPPGRQVSVNGQAFDGPVLVARRSRLKEISFVALGADESTSARIAANAAKEVPMTFEQWLEAKGFKLADLSDQQKQFLQASYDAEIKAAADDSAGDTIAAGAGDDTTKGGAGDDTIAASAGDDLLRSTRARLVADKRRIGQIADICVKYEGRVDAKKLIDIEASAIEKDWDADKTELELIRAERPRAGSVGNSGARGGKLDATVIEASMSLSVGIPERVVAASVHTADRERVMNEAVTGPMRGYSLHALMDGVIHASGMYFNGNRKSNDYIRTALQAETKIAASGFSTLSLSGILSNVANKGLIAAYQAVEVVWNQIAAVRSHSDFKVHTRYRLDSTGAFRKVGPDGQLKHIGLSDASYTNQVDTFGAIIALTRQMMINDDLGAFMEIPNALGRLSALRIEEATFVTLLGGVGSFFVSGNGNYLAGAGTALSLTSLTTAEAAFSNQVDSNNKPILVTPKKILTGTGLKTTVENLFAEKLLIASGLASTSSKTLEPARNPHVGKYPPVVSPYVNNTAIKDQDNAAISGQSSTAWVLLADPAVRAAIAVAFLNGQQTPTIESAQTDFNTLGMQWRGFHDFGVGFEDPKAAHWNAGA